MKGLYEPYKYSSKNRIIAMAFCVVNKIEIEKYMGWMKPTIFSKKDYEKVYNQYKYYLNNSKNVWGFNTVKKCVITGDGAEKLDFKFN